MAAILVLAAVALGAASLLFSEAHDQVYKGVSWASDVCTASKMFCTHPEYLGYGAGVALLLGIVVKLGGSLSGN